MLQFFRVAGMCLPVVGNKAYIAFTCGGFEMGHIALIELLENMVIGRVATNAIEQFDKVRVALTIDQRQFDSDIMALVEGTAAEKIRSGVGGPQEVPFIVFHHRSQLLEVADEQHLHTAERLERTAIVAQ